MRPHSIDALTHAMTPDGVFVTLLDNQLLQAHLLTTGPTTQTRVFIEGVSDIGIQMDTQANLVNLVSNRSNAVTFRGSFSRASPGTPYVSFIVDNQGSVERIIKKIWVMGVNYSKVNNTWIATVPEGTMAVRFRKGVFTLQNPCECGEKKKPPYGFYVPTEIDTVWTPNPSYTGANGPLLSQILDGRSLLLL